MLQIMKKIIITCGEIRNKRLVDGRKAKIQSKKRRKGLILCGRMRVIVQECGSGSFHCPAVEGSMFFSNVSPLAMQYIRLQTAASFPAFYQRIMRVGTTWWISNAQHAPILQSTQAPPEFTQPLKRHLWASCCCWIKGRERRVVQETVCELC